MQVCSLLRISPDLNWAYVLCLRKQFLIQFNSRKQLLSNNNKTSSRSSFRNTKAKGVVGFLEEI